MKENSIEKTIKQLELILKARKIHKECVGESCINCNPDIEALTSSIEFLSDYKRVLKENEELKDYIILAPNLDEMTAVKYMNIQREAYMRGRAEEQQKAEQIIYENYIPVQKVKNKVEELKNNLYTIEHYETVGAIHVLQELIESED